MPSQLPAPPVVVSDMDGTLTTVDTWRAVQAWVRANADSPAARRFVRVRLPRIVLARAGLLDREAFRARWNAEQARLLRGLAVGRVEELGRWVVAEHLWPGRRHAAVAALHAAADMARAAHPGARLLLATGAYASIGEAFAEQLGADAALATPLEVRDGLVTGALLRPTQAGEAKAEAVAAAAAGGRVLAAFGDTVADIPMLRLAERAVAVAPDARLRREAVARGWEILEG